MAENAMSAEDKNEKQSAEEEESVDALKQRIKQLEDANKQYESTLSSFLQRPYYPSSPIPSVPIEKTEELGFEAEDTAKMTKLIQQEVQKEIYKAQIQERINRMYGDFQQFSIQHPEEYTTLYPYLSAEMQRDPFVIENSVTPASIYLERAKQAMQKATSGLASQITPKVKEAITKELTEKKQAVVTTTTGKTGEPSTPVEGDEFDQVLKAGEARKLF